MQTQLQDSVCLFSFTLLDLLQSVYIPRVQHYRLFADDIGTEPETVSDMCVVQIVWGTDRYIIYLLVGLFEFCTVAVE